MIIINRMACIRLFVVTMLVTTSAQAGIQLNGTRVVYPANEREVSLGLVNDGTEARLVQSWVDSGDVRERPEDSKAPFIITPPMTRVDPGKGQTLRIIFSGSTMPQDRESVFWLNILEIPPKPAKKYNDESENYVQMAVRSRIKIFYRPQNLPDNPDLAVNKLTWRLMSFNSNSAVMKCINETPYNVSFSDVSFENGPVNRSVSKGGMCPAKSEHDFTLPGSLIKSEGKLKLVYINDYGAFVDHAATFYK